MSWLDGTTGVLIHVLHVVDDVIETLIHGHAARASPANPPEPVELRHLMTVLRQTSSDCGATCAENRRLVRHGSASHRAKMN